MIDQTTNPGFRAFMDLAQVAATPPDEVVQCDITNPSEEDDDAWDAAAERQIEAVAAIAKIMRYAKIEHAIDVQAAANNSPSGFDPTSSYLTVGFEPDGWRLRADVTGSTWVRDDYRWMLLVGGAHEQSLDQATSQVITGALEPWLYAAIKA